jgi:hypothetical protein
MCDLLIRETSLLPQNINELMKNARIKPAGNFNPVPAADQQT